MLPIETIVWGFLGSSAVELVTLLGFYFHVGAATPLIVSLLAKGLRPGPPYANPAESDPLASVEPSPERAQANASERR